MALVSVFGNIIELLMLHLVNHIRAIKYTKEVMRTLNNIYD